MYLNRGAKPITVIDHLKSEHEATAKPAPDADLDGVPDDADRCPHTPAAARGLVDPRGCPLDSDRDGLADYLDRCPEQFADIRVDSNGCPADFDQDGITDDQDHCPRTPLGYPVDRSGCPELKRIFARVILHPQAAEGGHLDQATESAVAQLISKLRDFPDVQVRIGGYTDNSQASELSRARAERQALLIRDFLVAHNVAIERIQCEGRGAIGFVDTNTTPEGRANNERVEIDFSF